MLVKNVSHNLQLFVTGFGRKPYMIYIHFTLTLMIALLAHMVECLGKLFCLSQSRT